jgi:hypothetical protein
LDADHASCSARSVAQASAGCCVRAATKARAERPEDAGRSRGVASTGMPLRSPSATSRCAATAGATGPSAGREAMVMVQRIWSP